MYKSLWCCGWDTHVQFEIKRSALSWLLAPHTSSQDPRWFPVPDHFSTTYSKLSTPLRLLLYWSASWCRSDAQSWNIIPQPTQSSPHHHCFYFFTLLICIMMPQWCAVLWPSPHNQLKALHTVTAFTLICVMMPQWCAVLELHSTTSSKLSTSCISWFTMSAHASILDAWNKYT